MSARVVFGLIIILAIFCASGAGYYGGQLGYDSYGWIGAVIGGVIGAIIGAVVGVFAGAFIFARGDVTDKEENWGETLVGILGAILGLLIFVGVCGGVYYLMQTYDLCGIIVVVPIALLALILIIYSYYEKIKGGSRTSSSPSPHSEFTDKKPHQDNLSVRRTKRILDLRDWKPNLREYKRDDWWGLIIGVVVFSLIMGYMSYRAWGWIGAVVGGIFGGVVSGIAFILQKTPGGRRWS